MLEQTNGRFDSAGGAVLNPLKGDNVNSPRQAICAAWGFERLAEKSPPVLPVPRIGDGEDGRRRSFSVHRFRTLPHAATIVAPFQGAEE